LALNITLPQTNSLYLIIFMIDARYYISSLFFLTLKIV